MHEQGIGSYVLPTDRPALVDDRSAVDTIGEALGRQAELVVVDVSRLPADFFDLRNRRAGEVLQKFVNYGLRVAFVGSIAGQLAASALAAFVSESNRGRQVLFVDDTDELEARLAREHLSTA